jgi:hypothetical protein
MMGKQKIVKLAAKITGLIASLIAVYFVVTIGLLAKNEGDHQIMSLNAMFVFLIFGFIIAWFRAREGGVILAFGSLIVYLYFSYLPAAQFPLFWFYSLMFIVPGALFLYLSFLEKKEK